MQANPTKDTSLIHKGLNTQKYQQPRAADNPNSESQKQRPTRQTGMFHSSVVQIKTKERHSFHTSTPKFTNKQETKVTKINASKERKNRVPRGCSQHPPAHAAWHRERVARAGGLPVPPPGGEGACPKEKERKKNKKRKGKGKRKERRKEEKRKKESVRS